MYLAKYCSSFLRFTNKSCGFIKKFNALLQGEYGFVRQGGKAPAHLKSVDNLKSIKVFWDLVWGSLLFRWFVVILSENLQFSFRYDKTNDIPDAKLTSLKVSARNTAFVPIVVDGASIYIRFILDWSPPSWESKSLKVPSSHLMILTKNIRSRPSAYNRQAAAVLVVASEFFPYSSTLPWHCIWSWRSFVVAHG